MRYLKTIIKDYKVGAITHSSRYVIKKIIEQINPQTKSIIEYGPGDGVITKKLLKILHNEGDLTVIETNKKFVEILKKINDKRLKVILGDSFNIKNNPNNKVDAIISGIPLSFYSNAKKENMIKNAHKILKPNGLFIIYQYSPFVKLLLKKYFKQIKIFFIPLNILPCFIIKAKK